MCRRALLYSGFHFDPQLASRDDFWFTMAAISLKKRGNPIFVPTNPNPHRPFSECKNTSFERSYGHFGFRAYGIKFGLEPEFLDTGFRHLFALGSLLNAHLAVNQNQTPHRRSKGPKPEESII